MKLSAVRRPSSPQLKAWGALFILIALGSWALASPVGASPDENFHVASIYCAHGTRAGLCEPGSTPASRRMPAQLVGVSCFMFYPSQSANCQTKSTELVNTDRGNFAGQYPPVFYWVDGFFAGPDLDKSVIAMRLVNALLFVALVVAVYLLVPVGLRRPMIAGALLTVVPLGMFLIPSINPSSWAILSGTTLMISTLGYLITEDRRRRLGLGALAGVSLLIGAGARVDAAVYAVVAVAAAAILTSRRGMPHWRRLIYPAVLVVIAAVAFRSAGQADVAAPSLAGGHALSIGRLARTAIGVPELWVGGMGVRIGDNSFVWGLGWLDTAMPGGVWVAAWSVFAAVVFLAVGGATWRRGLAVGLVGLAALAVPTYILYLQNSYVGDLVQPRYILPLLTVLAVTAMVRLDGAAFRLTSGQRWIVVAALSIANAVALHINIRRYVTGIDVVSWNLDRGVEWWWSTAISPSAVFVVGALAFGVGTVLLTKELTAVTAATDGVPDGVLVPPVEDVAPDGDAGPVDDASAGAGPRGDELARSHFVGLSSDADLT